MGKLGLALDKVGNLVIIENKLDDSGRDVVWQALKYASYCASSTKNQIVEIYQEYLDHTQTHTESELQNQTSQPADAVTRICEFLDVPDLDEIKLNLVNSQRLMLVASNFRKEVTSTAIWLLRHGINIQCFKVTPYKLDEQILLNFYQIIPPTDAKEFIIGINAKETDEKNTEVMLQGLSALRYEYWKRNLDAFLESPCDLFNNIDPSKNHWISVNAGLKGCSYVLDFLKKELRVCLWVGRSVTEENKFLFDFLSKQKLQIEQVFGKPLDWMRENNKSPSRIQFSCRADGFDKETWPQFIDWHLDHMIKLEQALKEPLQKAAEALKQKDFE